MNNLKILVLAEHDNKTLKSQTANVIACAKKISQDISVIVLGYQCHAVAETIQKHPHVSEVLIMDHPALEHGLCENVAASLQKISQNYQYILASTSTYGKNILPRLAAFLNVSQISDVIEVKSLDTFKRPMYAGNIVATVQSSDPIKILTIRPMAFDAVPFMDSRADIVNSNDSRADIVHVNDDYAEIIDCSDKACDLKLSTFMNESLSDVNRPDLISAKIVIAGGRGLNSRENFTLLEKLADQMHAAVGATRAAVDAGFISNDYQIGQTGKTVAPSLYIAIGISGAIQHLAGMKESKVIVAINKDSEAPIFQIADYGLVGDLFQILPELTQELAVLATKNKVE